MRVDKELILKVAENARLKLSEEEIQEFIPQLREVLESFSVIDGADVRGVKPGFQPVEVKNVLRDDVVGRCLSQQDALRNTEHKKDGYFKGPKAV